MIEVGMLNREIADILSSLGHMDEVIIADAGFPLPLDVLVVDIALKNNVPLVTDVLEEIVKYFSVEKLIFANETKKVSPTRFNKVVSMFQKDIEVETMSHVDFKKHSKNVKAIIRTGDFTAYANVLLVSGAGDRWYIENPK